jgi:hypothetical protein
MNAPTKKVTAANAYAVIVNLTMLMCIILGMVIGDNTVAEGIAFFMVLWCIVMAPLLCIVPTVAIGYAKVAAEKFPDNEDVFQGRVKLAETVRVFTKAEQNPLWSHRFDLWFDATITVLLAGSGHPVLAVFYSIHILAVCVLRASANEFVAEIDAERNKKVNGAQYTAAQ